MFTFILYYWILWIILLLCYILLYIINIIYKYKTYKLIHNIYYVISILYIPCTYILLQHLHYITAPRKINIEVAQYGDSLLKPEVLSIKSIKWSGT